MKLLEVNPLNIEIAKEKNVCDGSFSIETGDVVLLTGPNGCGKSTVIKILMGDVFDYSKLKYSSSKAVFYKEDAAYSILEKQSDMEFFRQNVCYVSQDDEFESNSILDCFISSIARYDIGDKEKYVYDFILKYGVFEAFYFDSDTNLDLKARKIAKRIGLKVSKLTDDEKKTLKFMSMNVKKMSGGQRKLSNIVTNLIRYEFCSLLILDEPLNNLDYRNVRAFSNILTKIYRAKPGLGILMVTHCRSIPIINKVISIEPNEKLLAVGGTYICNSCFGEVGSDGLYL